jgi:formylglycine-generating enzyme required for sulfatase activity
MSPRTSFSVFILPALLFMLGYVTAATAPAPVRKAKWPKSVTNSIGMKLVLIPAGRFTMGSPRDDKERRGDETQHEVEITRPFYLGVHEVTQAQFKKVMGKNPSFFSKGGKGKFCVRDWDSTDDFPVDWATWNDAVEFCQKLSALPSEKRAGQAYRLPTEAEWEYACRGRATSYRLYSFGNSLSARQANMDGMNGPAGTRHIKDYLWRTTRVGSYSPNASGLYDMHGNVCEWCSDWYGKDYYMHSPRKDPQGPASGEYRVMRGGSWCDTEVGCRTAGRSRGAPDHAQAGDGFRVVCFAEAAKR